jgi:hypothetical protein
MRTFGFSIRLAAFGGVVKLQQRLDVFAQWGINAAHFVQKGGAFVEGSLERREKQVLGLLR